MARFIIVADYTGPNEWSVGVDPSRGPGEDVDGADVVRVLRSIADAIEADGIPPLPAKYPSVKA